MFAPADLGPTVRITTFTLTGLSTCVVAIRCYCRVCVVGKMKLYDYIILASLICAWSLTVTVHYILKCGAGKELPPPPPPGDFPPKLDAALEKELVVSAISWFTFRILYIVTLGLIKLSILSFYLSFATRGLFRDLTLLSIGIVCLFTIVTGFFNGFECPKDPSVTLSSKIYDPRYASQCINRSTLYYAQATFNIASDFVILLLPLPSLLRLRMHPLKRALVLTVFCIGLLVPIASALRIWGLVLWATSGPRGNYFGAYILFWSEVEINTAVCCASAPSLQPLFRKLFESLVTARTRGTYYRYGVGTRNGCHADATRARERMHGYDSAYGHARGLSGGEAGREMLESPSPSYQPDNKRSTFGTEAELIVTETGLVVLSNGGGSERDDISLWDVLAESPSGRGFGRFSPSHERHGLRSDMERG